MIRIRSRLFPTDDRSSGLTLIEVVVAMMVFSIVALGVAYSMLSVLAATKDSRGRLVASNLASQEIDLARSVEDIFQLLDVSRDIEVDNTVYTIERLTNWVDSSGGDESCGATGASGTVLQYKRVNVTVTWPGMRLSNPVRMDTVVAPGSKINDPTKGTILVKVLNAEGTGSAGVSVSAVATVDGGPVTAPPVTDSQGCTYLLKVTPGTYKVSISRTGYINNDQEAAPSTLVGVKAGSSASAGFQYDLAATLTIRYASNDTTRTVKLPTNLDTTFLSSYKAYSAVVPGSTLDRTLAVHPFSSGYEMMTGKYAVASELDDGCISVDPTAWPDTDVDDGPVRSGSRPEPVITQPGGVHSVDVPMGIVKISTILNLGASALTATTVSPIDDDPGCDKGLAYTFGNVLPINGSILVALPYGSWQFKNTNGILGKLSGTTVEVMSGGVVKSDGKLMLDPRTATP